MAFFRSRGTFDSNWTEFTFVHEVSRFFDHKNMEFHSQESEMMYHSIFGFSAGFPDCCVVEFIKRTTLKTSDIQPRMGVAVLTAQVFALCPGGHEENEFEIGLNSSEVQYSIGGCRECKY